MDPMGYSFCTLPGRRWSKDRTGVVSCVFSVRKNLDMSWQKSCTPIHVVEPIIFFHDIFPYTPYIFPYPWLIMYTIFLFPREFVLVTILFFHERPWRADPCIFHKWFLSRCQRYPKVIEHYHGKFNQTRAGWWLLNNVWAYPRRISTTNKEISAWNHSINIYQLLVSSINQILVLALLAISRRYYPTTTKGCINHVT